MQPPHPAAPLLGRLGAWSNVNHLPAHDAIAWARRVEALDYDALWVNETAGWEPFAMLGALAASTGRIALGVGIAMTYARDALAAHAGARTIAELSGGRFVMGLGVSHASSVELRGRTYASPLATMRAYLAAYHGAAFQASATVAEPPLVVAALGPRMLELAATEADGAFPYLVPVEEVARVRNAIDAAAEAAGRPHRPLLVVTAAVRLETDPDRARAAGRAYMDRHLGQPNYLRNLARCGFTAEEVAKPGADRLVDALVGWGDAGVLRQRVEAMLAAGADHVAVIPLAADGRQADVGTLDALAPGRR